MNGVGDGAVATVTETPVRPARAIEFRLFVTNTSIKRGSNVKGERKTGVTVHAVGTTVETDTTFTLTWNGRPTDELHPDNPTQLTIKAGECCVRTSLAAAADSDDPRVYNQPVKGAVVAKSGSLTLTEDLIVRDDEPLPKVSLSATDTVEESAAFRVRATLAHRLEVNTKIPFVVWNPSKMTLQGMPNPLVITIPAGELSGETGDIRKQDDGDPDGYGDVYFSINGVNFKHWWPSSKQAKVRVTDDDSTDPELRRYAGAPRLFTACNLATESGDVNTVTRMPITVFLYPTTRATVTVDYRTVDGSAKSGVNYRSTSGTLTFGRREKTKTFEVDVLDDGVGAPASRSASCSRTWPAAERRPSPTPRRAGSTTRRRHDVPGEGVEARREHDLHGGLRHWQRRRTGGQRLHGDQRDPHLRAGRKPHGGGGAGARRHGRGQRRDVLLHPVEPGGGSPTARVEVDGDGHDPERRRGGRVGELPGEPVRIGLARRVGRPPAGGGVVQRGG